MKKIILVLGILLALLPMVFGATLGNTDSTGLDVSYTMTTDGTNSDAMAQTFNNSEDMDVNKIDLALYKDYAGASCTMTVDIRSGSPSGANVCTSSTELSSTEIDENYPSWKSFQFSNCQLSAGTTYALVLRDVSGSGCESASEYEIWSDTHNADKYGGTALHSYWSNNNQGSWTSETGQDLPFIIEYNLGQSSCDYTLGDVVDLPQITSSVTPDYDTTDGVGKYVYCTWEASDGNGETLTPMNDGDLCPNAPQQLTLVTGTNSFDAVITSVDLTYNNGWQIGSPAIVEQVSEEYDACYPEPDQGLITSLLNLMLSFLCGLFGFGFC